MTEQEQMIADCMFRESRLTDWQRGFIDSIEKQLTDGRSLTKKQDAMLTEVWEAATAKG